MPPPHQVAQDGRDALSQPERGEGVAVDRELILEDDRSILEGL